MKLSPKSLLPKWTLILILLAGVACQEEPVPTAEPEPTQIQETAPTPDPTSIAADTPEPEIPDLPTETPTSEPTATPEPATATPSVVMTLTAMLAPTAEATPTLEPTIPPTPTEEQTPLPIPTPLPLAENAISPENVGQLTQSGRLGWGDVDRLRYSPDGFILAVATDLGIFLHDAETGEQLRVVNSPSPLVAFNFSPDGDLMASGHNDGRIRIWQVSDGELVRTIESQTAGAVWSVAFSPDGQQIASAVTNENGLIYIHRVEDGALLRSLSGHQSRVRDVVFSPDGQYLASASIDWEVRIWNAGDGSQHARLRGHDGPVWRVTFTPDSQTLISAGSNGETGLWRVSDGGQIEIFVAQSAFIEIIALAVSPDGERFYTAGEDGNLRAWDIENRDQVFEIDFPLIVQEVTVSPDGQSIAALLGSNIVQIFDAATGEEKGPSLPYNLETIGGLAYSPNGSAIYMASFWDLKYWSIGSDSLAVRSLSDNSLNNLQTVVYDPNGRYFATGSSSRAFWLWDGHTQELVGYFPQNAPGNQVIALATSGNGERLAVGWNSRLVSIAYIPENLSAKIEYNIETTARVKDVALSPDGSQLFAANINGGIDRWELTEDVISGPIPLPPLTAHTDEIIDLALSADGTMLISVDRIGAVKLWQVKDGALVAEINDSSSLMYMAAFSPDGQLFATGGVDQLIRIYRTEDQRLVKTLATPFTSIISLAFSPDGSTLAAGTLNAVVYFWQIPEE